MGMRPTPTACMPQPYTSHLCPGSRHARARLFASPSPPPLKASILTYRSTTTDHDYWLPTSSLMLLPASTPPQSAPASTSSAAASNHSLHLCREGRERGYSGVGTSLPQRSRCNISHRKMTLLQRQLGSRYQHCCSARTMRRPACPTRAAAPWRALRRKTGSALHPPLPPPHPNPTTPPPPPPPLL